MDIVEKVSIVLFKGDEKTWHKLLFKNKLKSKSLHVLYQIFASKFEQKIIRTGKH